MIKSLLDEYVVDRKYKQYVGVTKVELGRRNLSCDIVQ